MRTIDSVLILGGPKIGIPASGVVGVLLEVGVASSPNNRLRRERRCSRGTRAAREQTPAEWVDYAEAATATIGEWVNGD